MNKDRYLCPCCFMPTLDERAGYYICKICFWEDDGQDSDDSEVVRDGPNGNYSLDEARENFKNNNTMYRIEDERAFNNQKKSEKRRMELYLHFIRAIMSENEEEWNQALEYENQFL